MNKRIPIIAAALVVLVVAVMLVVRGNSVDVRVATVVRDTLTLTIAAEGTTRSRDRFTVAAPISGRLTRVELMVGDTVREGQLVGRLFPAPEDPRVVAMARTEVDAARARYHDAEARLREAEMQAVQAEREAERRRPLFEMGAITRERMEQAELAAVVARERQESAEAGLASIRAGLAGAEARLLGAEGSNEDVNPVDVMAPVSGRVVSVADPSERVVAAGSPIVALAETGGLEVVLDILSEDAVRVESGHLVVLTGWGGEGALKGRVRVVTLVGYTKVSALGVEEQRVDVIADLLDPPPALGTGYRVSGDIVVWTGSALVVPTSAVFRDGDAWQVFVVREGKAQRRDVVLGHRNERAAEIVTGLIDGDRVIVFPPETVDDGTSIRIPGDGG